MNKRSLLFTTLLSASLLTTACSSNEAPQTTEKVAINVQVNQVAKESLDAVSSLTGTLEPIEETAVSFEVGGLIQTINAEVGDKVAAGSVLASLNATDYELQVRIANNSLNQANIDAANARVASAQAGLQSVIDGAREQELVQAKLTVSRAESVYKNLEDTAKKMKALYEEGLVSKKEYDDVQLQMTNAKIDLENAQARFSLTKEGATTAQIKQAEAAVQEAKAAKGQAENTYKQAQLNREQAMNTLAKTQLKSPINGVVLSHTISEGQKVNPGDMVYKIGQINKLKVLLPVPDREAKNWKVGDSVKVTMYDKEKTGTVSRVYPVTNANTGTINVEVVIPNDDAAWVPGQVVKANRVSADNVGIVVPIDAVVSSGQETYVFKVVKKKAVKTVVTVGQLVDNKIHVVSGLKEGDRIVTRGAELLIDGDPVVTDGGKSK